METVRTTGAVAGRGRRARRSAAALLVGGALLLSTAACNDDGGGKGSTDAKGGASAGAPADSGSPADGGGVPKASAAQLTVTPADGAADVQPKDGLRVAVTGGKLTTVTVTDKNGKAVDGKISDDGLSWKPGGQLGVGTTYTVSAQAVDAEGLVAASTSTFTTLTPAKTAGTSDNIADNGTYGVGMIVSVTFAKPIKNKEAVLGGITVTSSDGKTARGHWFGDKRVDFRPEDFWTPNTKVTVKYRLKNVEVSPGVYGDVDKDEPFGIGRYQVSTVDAAAHTMTVDSGGGRTETVPITAGNDENPSWNGTMLIYSKEVVTRMNSATVANVKGAEYDVQDVPHAMRLTRTGTYVHGNYWGGNVFGRTNASHGCVGLADVKGGSDTSNGGKFFKSSIIGDVVKIKNSKGKTVDGDNGLSGWTIPWSKW
ncbi:L,D-transpeptidase [Kitasatospora phosalacinea]|uniref:L,D-transpeptidase n=1 Tax=Kitasatospora phosalacinea TaxID=2065 RepID=UPI0009E02C26|nr:Ig-like domain-containing protein [Kitasatospora phosalacinea]